MQFNDLEDHTTICPKTLLKTTTETLLLTTRRLLLTLPRRPIEAANSNARLNQSASNRARMDAVCGRIPPPKEPP